MSQHGPPEPVNDDPATFVALIYRIAEEPRRAFNLTVILLPILAALIQVAAPAATAAGFPAPALWWGGTGVMEIGWLARIALRRLRRKNNTSLPAAAGNDHRL
jgi:hypothetical protein